MPGLGCEYVEGVWCWTCHRRANGNGASTRSRPYGVGSRCRLDRGSNGWDTFDWNARTVPDITSSATRRCWDLISDYVFGVWTPCTDSAANGRTLALFLCPNSL